MVEVNALLAQAKAAVVDHSKQTEGFERELPVAGPTPARLIGYVEIGKQPQEFNGQKKNPALEVMLTFELNGPKHQRPIVVDGVEKIMTNRVTVQMPIYSSTKAGFSKLFNTMRDGNASITNMAQMLGEPFIVTIVHNKAKNSEKVYANIKDANGWKVGPPIFTNPATGETMHVNVPEPTQDIMLMLWDNPSKEQWESIFIDGEREVDDKANPGQKKKVSKNWMQRRCIDAVDFKGSALEDLIGGIDDLDLGEVDDGDVAHESQGTAAAPEAETKGAGDPLAGKAEADAKAAQAASAAAAEAARAKQEAAAAEAAKAAAAKAAAKPDPAPTSDADDLLAALGLK